MIVLGIETSCDETSLALVRDGGEILSNCILSQIKDHKVFGGVVPEIAARAHLQALETVFKKAMADAQVNFQDIDAIAATCGPGLIGGLIIGATFGKALALYHNKPFIPINHLEAHALTARLTNGVDFPYLLLLVSGGHCQIIVVEKINSYKILGSTLDDAIGETFDKVAKMLGLPYPGGPSIENAARQGNPNAILFPQPLTREKNCSFSFSGLKTAVRQEIEKHMPLSDQHMADICASFQKTVSSILINRLQNAIEASPHLKTLVIAGGVAANQYLRQKLENFCAEKSLSFVAPPQQLCTDNGAMIAWAGVEKLRNGCKGNLHFTPKPRWTLQEVSSERPSACL